MTGRQWEICEAIRDCTRARGYPQAIKEIGEMVGLSSSSTVYDHLKKIKGKGYITFEPGRPCTLRVVKYGNFIKTCPKGRFYRDVRGCIAVTRKKSLGCRPLLPGLFLFGFQNARGYPDHYPYRFHYL